jgi:hypothetical protein
MLFQIAALFCLFVEAFVFLEGLFVLSVSSM